MPSIAPDNPAGPLPPVPTFDSTTRQHLIKAIAAAPSKLRDAVDGLSGDQLNTKYRNWTIRQIVHHVADSHTQSVTRFKWALTETTPTIKAYHEGLWVELADSAQADVEPSLLILESLHARWVILLNSLSNEQFHREFLHPESGELTNLWTALNYYAWHGQHHTAQIEWVKNKNSW